MKKNSQILKKTRDFVEKLFADNLPKENVYHDFNYTDQVVQAIEKIGTASKLAPNEMEIALLAGYLHNTGLTKGTADPIESSQKIASEFLKSAGLSKEQIENILAGIKSTKSGHEPTNDTEAVICDAVLYPITQGDYWTVSQKQRKERELLYGNVQTESEWYESRIKYVIESKFHTPYGKEFMEPEKNKVLKGLKKKMKKHERLMDLSMEKELGVSPSELKDLKKKLMKVEGRPERGIETMFRLTSKNHLTLSGMADTKANIMISVNSIILSILIGSLMQKLDNNPQLVIPTYVMLIVNLGSIIFAILSTRPNITGGRFTREEIEANKTNLLFFGNFHKMERPDYQWGMKRMMEDGKYLYSSLIDDIFFLGVVLGRKYRYLRIAYNIFMYGLVLAVVAFMISNMIFEKG